MTRCAISAKHSPHAVHAHLCFRGGCVSFFVQFNCSAASGWQWWYTLLIVLGMGPVPCLVCCFPPTATHPVHGVIGWVQGGAWPIPGGGTPESSVSHFSMNSLFHSTTKRLLCVDGHCRSTPSAERLCRTTVGVATTPPPLPSTAHHSTASPAHSTSQHSSRSAYSTAQHSKAQHSMDRQQTTIDRPQTTIDRPPTTVHSPCPVRREPPWLSRPCDAETSVGFLPCVMHPGFSGDLITRLALTSVLSLVFASCSHLQSFPRLGRAPLNVAPPAKRKIKP